MGRYDWAYAQIPFPYRKLGGGWCAAEYEDIWPYGIAAAKEQGRWDEESGLVRGVPF